MAEGIKFSDTPKLTAEPANIPDNSQTLNWLIFDENGKKRAEVIFTQRPEQCHFSIQNGQRTEVESKLYYSAKVIANQEIFIK